LETNSTTLIKNKTEIWTRKRDSVKVTKNFCH